MTRRSGRVHVDVHLRPEDLRRALVEDVRSGLGGKDKALSPLWFYDERGSRLFEEITRLPEYYQTRAERRLLVAHADCVSELSGADTFVEVGAGVCEKSRVVLDALARRGSLRRYIPFDVSPVTAEVAEELAEGYRGLSVHAVIGDFHRHLDEVPLGGRRLVAFLGGTIGNLRPEQRRKFLLDLRHTMAIGDHLLLGTDLVKAPRRLVAAYNDAAGVTAEFNRNVLAVINRELGADFDLGSFDHVARWNAEDAWIEMRLRSRRSQQVDVVGAGLRVDFAEGEEVLTEISAKFRPAGVAEELAEAGFTLVDRFGAEEGDFLLSLVRAD